MGPTSKVVSIFVNFANEGEAHPGGEPHQKISGIDVKETHIILIHMLRNMGERLDEIEEQIDKMD